MLFFLGISVENYTDILWEVRDRFSLSVVFFCNISIFTCPIPYDFFKTSEEPLDIIRRLIPEIIVNRNSTSVSIEKILSNDP